MNEKLEILKEKYINYILKNMKIKNDFISSSNIKMKTGYSDILVEVDKKIINIVEFYFF